LNGYDSTNEVKVKQKDEIRREKRDKHVPKSPQTKLTNKAFDWLLESVLAPLALIFQKEKRH